MFILVLLRQNGDPLQALALITALRRTMSWIRFKIVIGTKE